MSEIFNVYCDESCHLEHDRQAVMVLGAVWCPREKCREINVRLREIKAKHDLKPGFEVKWTKVSASKIQFYLDLVDYFFDDDHLNFRALTAQKAGLNHTAFGQTHDAWYYKMYFNMLKNILSPEARFRIYVDIKDTRGGAKVRKLHEVLCNDMYDFSRDVIVGVQQVRSHEIEVLQLADLLIGAISYLGRECSGNKGKEALVARMKERSGLSLERRTLMRSKKVNLFFWRPSEGDNE